MCLITYSPEGPQKLDWRALDYSASHMNDDGFGIAWFDREAGKHGEWKVIRSLRHKIMQRVISTLPKDAPIIIHQRYATHGRVSVENCHPFDAAGVAVFHNGTISGTRAESRKVERVADGKYKYEPADVSDTRAWCEDELEPMLYAAGHSVLLDENMQWGIGNRVGWGSVITLAIPGVETPVIVNEERGIWEKGVFYSNTYSLPPAMKHYTGYATSSYASGAEWASEDEWDKWVAEGEDAKARSFREESREIESQETEGSGSRALVCIPGGLAPEDADACGLIDAEFDETQDYMPRVRPPHADAESDEWAQWLEDEAEAYQREKEST